MIRVLATITVAEGKRDDFLAEFHKLMPKVHAEEGCLEYQPMIDVATDLASERPTVVVIVEKWESLDHLKAHLAAPHMKEYKTAVKDIVKGMSLQILRPA